MTKTYQITYKVEMNINGVDINEEITETATLEDTTFELIMCMVEDADGIDIISCEEVDDTKTVSNSPLSVFMRLFGN